MDETTAVTEFDWKGALQWLLYAAAASGLAAQIDTLVSERLKQRGGVLGKVLVMVWDRLAGNYFNSQNAPPPKIKAPTVKVKA